MTHDNTKHTPGPWEARIDSGQASYTIIRPNAVAMVYSSIAFEVLPQNANLIAAAPELLEALKYLRRFVHSADVDTAFVDAVITKAEGREVAP